MWGLLIITAGITNVTGNSVHIFLRSQCVTGNYHIIKRSLGARNELEVWALHIFYAVDIHQEGKFLWVLSKKLLKLQISPPINRWATKTSLRNIYTLNSSRRFFNMLSKNWQKFHCHGYKDVWEHKKLF